MRTRHISLLLLLASILFILSCKKDSNPGNEQGPGFVTVDFTSHVNAGVNGFITDENGHAIAGAVIEAGGKTTTTNSYGYFKIEDASFAKTVGFIKVIQPGYFNGYRSFTPVENGDHFTRLQLLKKNVGGTIDASTGGHISLPGNGGITIPANAVMIASNNTPYTGVINVSAQWLDPSNMPETELTMPGDLSGMDNDNHLSLLKTYGMMVVELTGSSGELLQITDGNKATLNFPIPVSLQGDAPASIALWYFDETKGIWKEEGSASKNGNEYKAAVGHFSFWNCDSPNSSLVNFSVQLTDTTSGPLSNVEVIICHSSDPYDARIAFTDANGQVSGWVPANSDLLLKIRLTCNPDYLVEHVVTANESINLGSVKVNIAQDIATLMGNVNKCDGSPVTNGYIIISENNDVNSVINVQNGFFNAGSIVCGTVNAVVVPFDLDESLPGDAQYVIINPGINNFGTLSACAAAPYENFSYTLDGVPNIFIAPGHMFSAAYDPGQDLLELAIYTIPGGIENFRMYLTGGTGAGGHYTASNLFTLTDQYEFLTATLINISNYGNAGEFITGNYAATVKKLSDNSIHTFSASFNFLRSQ